MATTANEALQEFLTGRAGAGSGYEPVVVKIEYEPGKFTYGVQYWSAADIARGTYTNPDKTPSVLQFTVAQAIENMAVPA